MLRKANVSMQVVKNTLAKRALASVGITGLDEYFIGPTSVIWSQEDSITPASILLDFVKKYNKGTVKAGLIDGTIFEEDAIAAISKLPTKHELYARTASALAAPITKLARVLNALPVKFVRTVDALREQKEQG